MEKQIKLVACISLVALSFVTYSKIIQAMPRRLTGVKLKSMSSSQTSSSSTSLSRNTSPSRVVQRDGGLPSTSNLPASSGGVQGATGGSESVVRPKTYSSLFPKSNSSSSATIVSQVESLNISGTESSSSGLVVVKSKSSIVVTTETGGSSGGNDSSPVSKWRPYPHQLKVGQLIYKPTFEGDRMKKNVSARPHLIVKTEQVSGEMTAVSIVDMSRAEGKGRKPYIGQNYMINPEDPGFSGKNSGFVKLDTLKTIYLKNSVRQKVMGKEVNQGDVDEILKRLGLKD